MARLQPTSSPSVPRSPVPASPVDVPADSSRRYPAGPAAASEAEVDATLVRRFKSGDDTAFVEIMRRYREKVFFIALRMLRNRADAEEIAQDTFVRAHRALADFRGDSSLATWLHRIALNLSHNRYWYFFRRRRQDTLSLDVPLSDDSAATFSDLFAATAPSPDRAAVTGEFSELVAECLEKLDAPHREILTLRTVLNRSYDEIAATLGISVGTVKSRIARARGHLRRLLAAECPEFSAEAEPSDWFEPQRGAFGLDFATA
jgi:RNA polymerase sigma-70 factor (ECF subfamily)